MVTIRVFCFFHPKPLEDAEDEKSENQEAQTWSEGE